MIVSRNTTSSLAAALLLTLAAHAGAQVTFAPAVNFSAGSGAQPVAIVARDLDGDATLDLTIGNGFVSLGSVAILSGSGTGSFGSPTTLPTGPFPSAFSVAIGDFNRDGMPDIAAAVAGGGVVSVRLGTGGGAFGPFSTYSVGGAGYAPVSVATGDFNRDGRLDLVTANQLDHSVSVLLGNGNGTFIAATRHAVGLAPFSVAVGDFNGDGFADLVTANPNSSDLSILLGTGTGAFSAAASIFPGGTGLPIAVATGDLNGDGNTDLVVGHQQSVLVLLGNGDGTFAAPSGITTFTSVTAVAVDDFDGDGKLDVASTAAPSSVYLQKGNGTGMLSAPLLILPVGSGPRAIVAADFNGDAIADLATANQAAGNVSVLLNTTPFAVGALAWGDNVVGSVGDGTTTTRGSPVPVANLGAITAIAAGDQHTLAVKADGTVWSWGAPYSGALGTGSNDPALVPVQVPGLDNAVAVAAGTGHSLALMADATVRAWGNNLVGQLGVGDTDGHNTPVPVVALTGVVALAASGGHSVALKADGTVWTFGRNDFGQLGIGTVTPYSATPVQVPGLDNVVAIAASSGGWHSLAVKANGTVWAWGRNNFAQIGDGTMIDRPSPVQIGGLGAVKALAAGIGHSVALEADGTVSTWGGNLHGQLGDGTTVDRLTPIAVPALGGVSSVSAGLTHTVVLKANGTVWAWGANSNNGQLGDGSFIERLSPVQVTGVSGARAVATGGQHSMVIVPTATITMLAAMVQGMSLPNGPEHALLATLSAAQSAVSAGHPTAACSQLGAFQNQVRAFRGRSLSVENAGRLTSFALRVQSGLGCG